jgi:hypothetical protein
VSFWRYPFISILRTRRFATTHGLRSPQATPPRFAHDFSGMLGASNEGINCGGGAEKRDQSKPRSSSVSPEEVDDFEANVQPDSPRPSPNSSPPPCAEPAQSQRPQEPSLSDGARTPPPQQGQNLLGHQVGEDPSQVAERMLSASLGARAEISLDSTRGTATRDDRSR